MLKKYAVLIGILIALALFFVAASYYPGGSQADKNSVGYNWKNNYMSNLFSEKAVNGADNTARPWASVGVFFYCLSFAVFFWKFSAKISIRSAANIIKYVGPFAMLCACLTITPYHDLMVRFSGISMMLVMFYITVMALKSKLLFMKFLCVTCILIFYVCNYIYYTQYGIGILPIMQKITLLISATWILCLEHFTTAADFQFAEKQKK